MTVFNRSMFRGGDAVQRDLHRLLGGGIGGLDPMAGAYDFLPRTTSSFDNLIPGGGVGRSLSGVQPSPVDLQLPDLPYVLKDSPLGSSSPSQPPPLGYGDRVGHPFSERAVRGAEKHDAVAELFKDMGLPLRSEEEGVPGSGVLIPTNQVGKGTSFSPDLLPGEESLLPPKGLGFTLPQSPSDLYDFLPQPREDEPTEKGLAFEAARIQGDLEDDVADAEEMRRLEQASHAAASAAEARENLESVKEEFLQTGLSSEKLERISKIRPGPRPDQPEAPKTLKQRITDNVNIMKEIFGVSNRDQAIERAMDMAYIGFAIASGQSPNFLTNVAQGLMAGTESIRERMGEDKEFDQRLTLAAYEQTLSEDAAAAERVAARDLKELELRLAAVKANETREQNRLDDVLELVQKTVLDAPEDYAKLLEGGGGGTLLLDPEDDESIMSLEEFTKRREEEVLETAAETYGIVGGGISEKVQVLRRGRQVAEELEELKRTLGALMIPADVTDEKTSDAIATRRLEVEKRIRELNKEMLELNNRLAPTSASPRG